MISLKKITAHPQFVWLVFFTCWLTTALVYYPAHDAMLIDDGVNAIQDIQQQGEHLRQLELDRAMKRLMRGEDPQEVLNAMAQGLTNKFLHGSLHALQHSNGAERDALIKLLPKLFASHSKPEDH